MVKKKDIKTVTAPVLVVESTSPVAGNKPTDDELKQQWMLEYHKAQQQQNAIPNPSKQPYVLMVLGMVALVTISIVLLETLSPPTRDNSASIAQIVGFAATTTAALFAYQKAQDTHVIVNSRLSQWMAKAEEAALRKGMDEGRDKANKRNDMLSDKSKNETR